MIARAKTKDNYMKECMELKEPRKRYYVHFWHWNESLNDYSYYEVEFESYGEAKKYYEELLNDEDPHTNPGIGIHENQTVNKPF